MAEPQSKGEILALEEELEREREDASRTFEDARRRLRLRVVPDTRPDRGQQIQEELEQLEAGMDRDRRRLGALVEEFEEAGRRVEEAETRLEEKTRRLLREAAEQRDAESRRTEARLAELAERLRGEAEERLHAAEGRATEAEERASVAEERAAKAEEARLDHEKDARASAAAWLQSQARAIEARAEKAASKRVSAARRDTVEKVAQEADERVARERERAQLEAEQRIRSEVARARREITSEAARDSADRERKEQEIPEGEVARYRELRGRIGSVRKPPAEAEAGRPAPVPSVEGPQVDVNSATFEELRRAGLSVTQATRVIAYRQRQAGIESVDELETIPGFPKSYLDELKRRLSA